MTNRNDSAQLVSDQRDVEHDGNSMTVEVLDAALCRDEDVMELDVLGLRPH